MGAIVLLAACVVVWAIVRAAGGGGRSYSWLASHGTPARGILLQVDATGTPVEGLLTPGIQRRGVTIDIEIPGQPPYVVSASAYLPRNLAPDVLPGATVELRVHPRQRSNIAIVGPGTGFAASALVDQQRAS
jgi:hypothetical protein